MRKVLKAICFSFAVGGLSACGMFGLSPEVEHFVIEPASEVGQPNTYFYTEPMKSGLKARQPFPKPNDVCVLLSSNSLTKSFETKEHFLIACPKHEMGAIGDRMARQKAKVIGNAKHWVVMHIPNVYKPALSKARPARAPTTGKLFIEPASEVGEPSTHSYTEAVESGLKALRPFPKPNDVCVLLSSNSLTKPFETKEHFLIACPKHEMGAIGDRMMDQRAKVVGNARHWVLMRIYKNEIN